MGAVKGEHRSPQSEFQKGERHSPTTEFPKGKVPWNKGLKYSLKHKIKPFPYEIPRLSKMQWAYIAGFCDGDGWITYKPEPNSSDHTVVFGLGQKEKMILEKIQGWLELEKGLTFNKRGYWSLQVVAKNKVLVILKSLEPYLIIKQERARVAIRYIQEDISRRSERRKQYIGN